MDTTLLLIGAGGTAALMAVFCLLLSWIGWADAPRWEISLAVAAFFAGWLAWIVALAGELHPWSVALCVLGGALLAGLQRALVHVIGRNASGAGRQDS